ncbi:unnamed protein product, partial [Prorocentrum cordatum]
SSPARASFVGGIASRVLRRPRPNARQVLRLPALDSVCPQVSKSLSPHTGDLLLASLSVAFATLPPSLRARLASSATIEVCARTRRERGSVGSALRRCKSAVGDGKLRLGAGLGRVAEKAGSFDWVRQKNGPQETASTAWRRWWPRSRLRTEAATSSRAGQRCSYPSRRHAVEDARRARAGARLQRRERRHGALEKRRVRHAVRLGGGRRDRHGSCDQVAALGTAHGRRQCGLRLPCRRRRAHWGQARSGGLDRGTWCVTSTLLGSLQQVQWDEELKRRGGADDPRTAEGSLTSRRQDEPHHLQYLPTDGCVVSPSVTLFRGTSADGYVFSQDPTELLAVCSIAMFNTNTRVRDSPVDAPTQFEEYGEQVRQKFRALLAAAAQLGAEAVVCPDVGCGVFGNDPAIVGGLLGQVAREYPDTIREIVVTGNEAFFDAARRAASGQPVPVTVPAYFQSRKRTVAL